MCVFYECEMTSSIGPFRALKTKNHWEKKETIQLCHSVRVEEQKLNKYNLIKSIEIPIYFVS